MQFKKSEIAIVFLLMAAVSGFIFMNSSSTAPQTAVAGDATPTLANYLPIILNPAATPTATATSTATATPTTPPTPTATATATAAPANVQITLIVYNPAGTDLDGEYVRLENKGGSTAVMTGWTLSDNDAHVYNFPAGFSLGPGAAVLVWVKSGANNATNLYWGSGQAVWTNTGDTAFLRSGGTLVDSCSYPGGGVQASC